MSDNDSMIMKTIEIKRINGDVIFAHTAKDNSVRHTIGQYIKRSEGRADLNEADLSYADLRGADLSGAYLRKADLSNIKINEYTSFFLPQCPSEGSFIGWKKAEWRIVKLLITADAKRSSATSLKCRCSKAKVLAIENIDGSDANVKEVASSYDSSFIYCIGKIVKVKNFDENRWNECSSGIHFFIDREMAVQY